MTRSRLHKVLNYSKDIIKIDFELSTSITLYYVYSFIFSLKMAFEGRIMLL